MAAGRVAVVGAGIAGLGAARGLARRGFQVSLFERERQVGGRARPVMRENFAIERPASMLSAADRALLSWIGELELPELLPPRPVVRALVHRDRIRVVDSRDLTGISRIPGIRPREALRLLRLPRLVARYGSWIDPNRPELAARIDDRSLADFARLYFGARVLDHWMEPLVMSGSLADAREVSRALFLHRYREAASARLGLLRGPSHEFLDRAARSLSSSFGALATGVECLGDGGVRLDYLEDRQARSADVDAVVLAVPAPVAAELAGANLSFAERAALGRIRYAPELAVAVALRRPFYSHPRQIHFPRRAGWPLESVLLEPGVEGGRVPQGRGLALLRATGEWSAAYFAAPDEAVSKELIDALGAAFPRIHGAALFVEVLREERAAPRFDVGTYRTIAALARIQADCRGRGRRIYFAGDYRMGLGWDAALRSGQRAAAEVEADLGRFARSSED